ncbi:hypothetical protein ACFFX0_22465 [Citricoccus parietis]|uniref:Uncharacterized protein n=1 Tax=Citricoccus parietis TaxID=592307 RepID=A0ABV5G4F2_9MICC
MGVTGRARRADDPLRGAPSLIWGRAAQQKTRIRSGSGLSWSDRSSGCGAP